jgi:hypothetical protein
MVRKCVYVLMFIIGAGPISDATINPEPATESMHAENEPLSSLPTFFASEPTRAGRKRKCRDMSGLSLCLCGDTAKPNDMGSIRCQKAGCETVWVSSHVMRGKFTLTEHTVPPSMCWVRGRPSKKLDLRRMYLDKEE